LGSVLLLAGQSGGTARAALCLAVYSAGLGLPFLGAAFLFERSFTGKLSVILTRLRPHLPLLRRVSGVFLICAGVLMLSGRYQALSAVLARGESSLEKRLTGALGAGATDRTGTAGGTAGNSDIVAAFNAVGLPVLPEPVPPPDFSLPLLQGGTVSLQDFSGKVVFLNFWATWCPPCRAEMPSMEALYQRFKEKGLEFVVVDINENVREVKEFINEYTLTFPVVLDTNGAVSNNYNIQAIPSTYIIDRDGKIMSQTVGGRNWNTPAIMAAFEELLKNE
jgi:peroxiredoxin